MTADKDRAQNLIKLNPALDMNGLKKRFAEHRRIRIPRILTEDSAERVARCLTSDVDWHLVFSEGDRTHTLYPEQVREMSEEDRQKVRRIAAGQAEKGFQFLYNDYNIYDYYLNGKNMGHFLHRFHEFVNTQTFLEFIRELSGLETISFADSQATAFGPGHFLGLHHDQVEGKNRKLSYSFNFTRTWQVDWGGILQFPDLDGNVEDGFIPAFNALDIFEVPQEYSVSYVAPFCPALRYSITGWLRETN